MEEGLGRTSSRGSRWVIVLAGGEGERLRPLVQSLLGCHRPKQYCAFTAGKPCSTIPWRGRGA